MFHLPLQYPYSWYPYTTHYQYHTLNAHSKCTKSQGKSGIEGISSFKSYRLRLTTIDDNWWHAIWSIAITRTKIVRIDFHRLIEATDNNRLYWLYWLPSDDRFSLFGHAGVAVSKAKMSCQTTLAFHTEIAWWKWKYTILFQLCQGKLSVVTAVNSLLTSKGCFIRLS